MKFNPGFNPKWPLQKVILMEKGQFRLVDRNFSLECAIHAMPMGFVSGLAFISTKQFTTCAKRSEKGFSKLIGSKHKSHTAQMLSSSCVDHKWTTCFGNAISERQIDDAGSSWLLSFVRCSFTLRPNVSNSVIYIIVCICVGTFRKSPQRTELSTSL